MRTWPKLLASGLALTIGLIACFAPGEDRIVTDAAARLPAQTPLLVAVSAPQTVLREVARVTGLSALEPDSWSRNGLDPTAPITLARLPGSEALWTVSAAIADEAVAATGVDDLLAALAPIHHAVMHDGRVHALIGLSTPDADTWRRAVQDFTETSREASLVASEALQPIGTDDVMIYTDPVGLSSLLDAPLWVTALGAMTDPCTVRGNARSDAWDLAVSCSVEEGSLLASLLMAPADDLSVSSEHTHAVAHLAVDPETLARLWETLADEDPELDHAHTALMDVAQAAGLSVASLWGEALTGEVAAAVTRWPGARRPAGLVGSLGVADEDLVRVLLEASMALVGELPGVRVGSDRDGWTVEWLRHRGHDLGLALDEERLWLSHGQADLSDARAVGEGEPWERGPGDASARVALGELPGLDGLLDGLAVDLDATETELSLSLALSRPATLSSERLVAGLLDGARALWAERAQADLAARLAAVCDAIDLHAIDHGLPASLDALQLASGVMDPWGHPLDYARPAVRRPHHRYDLCSRGPDGLLGSADDVCYE